MANEWMQFLTPETQALLAKSTQSNDVIRPAQAQGTDFSKYSSPQALQSGGQQQQQKPQSSANYANMNDPTTWGNPNGFAPSGGLGTNTGFGGLGIGTGSGALGLGNGQSLSDLGSAIGNGTGTVGQGLGSLFSLIGL